MAVAKPTFWRSLMARSSSMGGPGIGRRCGIDVEGTRDDVGLRELGAFGFGAIIIFAICVFESFVYLIGNGALDWGPIKAVREQFAVRTDEADGVILSNSAVGAATVYLFKDDGDGIMNAADALIAFGIASVDAGADLLHCGDSLASCDVISPKDYEQWAFPYQRKVIQAWKAYGAKTLLHICGDSTKVLDLYAETGADVIEVDHKVDLAYAHEARARALACLGRLDEAPDARIDAVRGCLAIERGPEASCRALAQTAGQTWSL